MPHDGAIIFGDRQLRVRRLQCAVTSCSPVIAGFATVTRALPRRNDGPNHADMCEPLTKSGWSKTDMLDANQNVPRALRPFWIAVVAAVLLLQVVSFAHAQRTPPSGPSGPSETEKHKMQEKRASQKEIDEAYKATLKKMPDAQQKIDPWGSMRTAPQK